MGGKTETLTTTNRPSNNTKWAFNTLIELIDHDRFMIYFIYMLLIMCFCVLCVLLELHVHKYMNCGGSIS